jgi:hypothetical protein
MSKIFWYQRPVTRKVKVEDAIEGPSEKEVTDIYWDCFNIDKVIRGHWAAPDQFIVLLDDGHEQADDVQKPKFNAKGQITGVEMKRERAWYVSQVPLVKEDVERFREVTEKKELKVPVVF